jgi:hypothetical protein
MSEATESRADHSGPEPDATKKPKRRLATLRGVLVAVLIGISLASFSIVPLWRLFWYWPVYGAFNFRQVKDAGGVRREAWRWIEGRTVRIYQHPEARGERTAEVAAGIRALIEEAGLDFAVEVRPMPDSVLTAYNACLVQTKDRTGASETRISFLKLQANLIGFREGDPHADVLIVNHPLAETPWAFALASFQGGTVALTVEHADHHTAKHEAAHLMGYMMHDTFPLFVFGYPWEGPPWRRNTLMVLLSARDDLSPRAKEALRYFWKRVEKKTGQEFSIQE